MKVTQIQKLQEALGKLEVGESINKHSYILENWERFDYFTKRSFDVVMCRARKLFPDKEFASKLKTITRTI